MLNCNAKAFSGEGYRTSWPTRAILKAALLILSAQVSKDSPRTFCRARCTTPGPETPTEMVVLCLPNTVECARHEGVVADGVREDDELGAAEAVRIRGQGPAVARMVSPMSLTALMLMPAREDPMFKGGADHACFCGALAGWSEPASSAEVMPLSTRALKPPTKFTPTVFAAASRGDERTLHSPRRRRRPPPARWGDGDALVDDRDAELSFDTRFADALTRFAARLVILS